MAYANPEYNVQVVLSAYKQGAWTTKLVDGSLTKSYPTKSGSPAQAKPVFQDDQSESGKGHEWITRQDEEYWDFKRSLPFDLCSWTAAWAGAFGLGGYSVSGPGGDGDYTHTCKFSVPAAVSRQNPFTSIVVNQSNIKRYYPDICVAGFTLDGKIKERPSLNIDLVGSGRFSDGAAFSFPSLAAAKFLRFSGLQFEFGEAGSLVDLSAKLTSFSLGVQNNIDDTDRYPAGCGLYASRARYGDRKLDFKFSVEREAAVELGHFEANTQLQAKLAFTGPLLAGTTYHKLTVTMTAGKIADITPAYENKQEVSQVAWTPFYTAADTGPIIWEVVNDEEEYQKSET